MYGQAFKRGSFMRPIVFGFFILASLFFSLTEAWAVEYPWKLRLNQEEISVYTRKVEASSILEYKAKMIVDAKLSKLIYLFEDVEKISQWYHQCVQSKLIQSESVESQIIYFVLHLPWPVAERDCVFRQIKSLDPVSGEVSYTLSAVSGNFPQQKGRIRALDLNSIWRFKPLKDGRTEVYFQQHSDPGGSIPSFLVNKLSVEIPFYSFKNLRQMIYQIKD